MTAMFPDSGVPPADAKNSLSNPDTTNCDELWYSTSRCQPRFDPAAANAMLAELINLINAGEVSYNCGSLNQVQLATKYLVQRGLMNSVLLTGGPVNYTAILDPPATRNHDFLMVRVVFNVDNGSGAKLIVNELPELPIVRNDGLPVVAGDLKAGIPVILIQYQSKWYVPYFVYSQLPAIQTRNLDIYVNWAIGDDANDGSANVSGKALKTIQEAVYRAYAYPPSQFQITIHVADSQNYHGFTTPTYPGPNLKIIGNVSSPQSVVVTGQNAHACQLNGNNILEITGVTAQTTVNAAGPGAGFVSGNGGNLRIANCRIGYCAGAGIQTYQGNVAIGGGVSFFGNLGGAMYWAFVNGLLGWENGVTQIIEGPITVGSCATSSQGGAMVVPPARVVWIGYANVTGVKYSCSMNGTIQSSGGGPDFFPGTIPGSVATGGQYV